MISNPATLDRFLREKGIHSRMDDASWDRAIASLAVVVGKDRWFSVKLLHQQEDPLRRGSPGFPAELPRPYRFIDYIRFWEGGEDSDLRRILRAAAIPHVILRRKNGAEDDDIVYDIRVGPKE